jgi:hypothetical protein
MEKISSSFRYKSYSLVITIKLQVTRNVMLTKHLRVICL